jgi:hypothetical protein
MVSRYAALSNTVLILYVCQAQAKQRKGASYFSGLLAFMLLKVYSTVWTTSGNRITLYLAQTVGKNMKRVNGLRHSEVKKVEFSTEKT